MEKIGIITYHFAQNYGSVLQCYALQEYIKNRGYDVKIINFVSEQQRKNNSLSTGIKGKIRDILFITIRSKRKRKIEKFLDFRKKNFDETNHISNIEELQQLVENEHFDYIISGSDQVFNPNIFDYNDAFVFPFKTNAIKIAYAASLGNAKEKELEKIKKYILDFKKISLREKNDKSIFEKVINRKINIVCDPVFLLTKKEWIEKIDKINTAYNINENYLLCYFIHKPYMNKSIKIAKKIAKEKKLRIKYINAGYNLHSFNKNTIIDCGPDDFLKLFVSAKYICTDSFHGTSFSIILNKDFTCVDTLNNFNDNRRKDLLEKMGLLSRFQYVENKLKNVNSIDFGNTNKIIEQYSNDSKTFLEFK